MRFAKLDQNPLIFEIKAERLNDLQINLAKPSTSSSGSPVDDLRDPMLARFDDKNVVRIQITSGGNQKRIKLEKSGADWKMIEPLPEAADRNEVTELLNLLKGMEARKGGVIDGPMKLPQLLVGSVASIDPKEILGLTGDAVRRVTLTFDASASKTDKSMPSKSITYLFGVRDAGANKRPVVVEGWTRINIVDDRAEAGQVSRLDRQPSSYRTAKLFDGIASRIGEIVVQRGAAGSRPADSFTVQQQAGTPSKWLITAPFKAEAEARAVSQLALELGGLANQKYIYDPTTDEPFKITNWPAILNAWGVPAPKGDGIFGLGQPSVTLTLKFAEPKGAPDVVLEIGKARSATEHYARVKGTSGIFAISDQIVKAVDIKANDLLDKTLIKLDKKEDIQTIRRSMGGQDLEITQNNSASGRSPSRRRARPIRRWLISWRQRLANCGRYELKR